MSTTMESPVQPEVVLPPLIPRGQSAKKYLLANMPAIKVERCEHTSTMGNHEVTRTWHQADFVGPDTITLDMELDGDGESDCSTYVIYHPVGGKVVSVLITPHYKYPSFRRDGKLCLSCDWRFEIGAVMS